MRLSLLERMKRWRRRLFGSRVETPREILVVRSGLSDRYYEFLAIVARVNRIALILDRRSHERRHPDVGRALLERRRVDRRGPPPATWQSGDVIVFRERGTRAGAPGVSVPL